MGRRKEVARYRVENAPSFYANAMTRSVFCDLFTCFLYLTDVKPGDGGLVRSVHHMYHTQKLNVFFDFPETVA